MPKPVPDGYQTITANLTVSDAAAAIEFYKTAFGAVEVMRFAGPGGGIVHAEIRIGDSPMMLSDEMPGMGSRSPKSLGASTGSLYLYVDNVDSWYERAIAAGATARMPVMNMFWGDRMCHLIDPFGHEWALATHIEDVSPQEMERRGQEFFAKMAAGHGA